MKKSNWKKSGLGRNGNGTSDIHGWKEETLTFQMPYFVDLSYPGFNSYAGLKLKFASKMVKLKNTHFDGFLLITF